MAVARSTECGFTGSGLGDCFRGVAEAPVLCGVEDGGRGAGEGEPASCALCPVLLIARVGVPVEDLVAIFERGGVAARGGSGAVEVAVVEEERGGDCGRPWATTPTPRGVASPTGSRCCGDGGGNGDTRFGWWMGEEVRGGTGDL